MRNNSPMKTFTVSGGGEFPFDMLRYDCCWPYSSADVAAMLATGRRDVVLQTQQISSPTVGRWDSFVWKVVS